MTANLLCSDRKLKFESKQDAESKTDYLQHLPANVGYLQFGQRTRDCKKHNPGFVHTSVKMKNTTQERTRPRLEGPCAANLLTQGCHTPGFEGHPPSRFTEILPAAELLITWIGFVKPIRSFNNRLVGKHGAIMAWILILLLAGHGLNTFDRRN